MDEKESFATATPDSNVNNINDRNKRFIFMILYLKYKGIKFVLNKIFEVYNIG